MKHLTLIGVIMLITAAAATLWMLHSHREVIKPGTLGPPEETFTQSPASLEVIAAAQTPDFLLAPHPGPTLMVKKKDALNFRKHFAVAASRMGWYTVHTDYKGITVVMPKDHLASLEELGENPVGWATNPPETKTTTATTPVKVHLPIQHTHTAASHLWALSAILSLIIDCFSSIQAWSA